MNGGIDSFMRWGTRYRDELLNDTLPFWINHCVDRDYGGFTMALGRDGTLVDTDKGVWQQARFTWLLGELFNNVERKEEWLSLALHGAEFLERCCFDATDGRMWFHVTREGQPIRKRRYSFTESFAAIAFGELAKATGESRFAELATRTFHQFLHHNLNPSAGAEKYTPTRPMRAIGFPMITLVTAQELRESIGLSDSAKWIDRSLSDIRDYHLKPEIQCVMETVGLQGEILDHFDGRTLNPGHAIEAAWFVLREAKEQNDAEMIKTGCQMLDWMWSRGWDEEHGGILYFADVRDLPVQEYWHDMKFWWPQCEALIATLLAFQLTGDHKYAQWHERMRDWTYARFPDLEYGEWFGYLHRDGTRSSSLKGNLWKGPFHVPRMQLTCWKLCEEIKASMSAEI